MGKKEDDNSYLSVKDFEKRCIEIDRRWTALQALLVAASVAFSKLEEDHLEKKKKLQPPAERNGFLKVEEGKNINKNVPGTSMADEKRAGLLKEEAGENPTKEEKENPSASSGNGRKLLADAMTSQRVFDCEELVNHQQLQENVKGESNLKIDISESLKKYIQQFWEGTSIMRVIQKSLYSSDVSNYHNRLSIPLRQVEQEFLTQEEKEMVEKGGKLEVLLVEPSLNFCEIVLAKWNNSYVLIKEWNNVKNRSKLKAGDEVQIWSFRTPEKLCFALVILRRS
ncbi:B3 domain-containing protein At5g24050-like [Mangifera indica]|uniref:B3 domain-containing protein At5g24050-like n=1 Tax=Mangifera indica TaxID=29780 RepID=UPI001CF98B9A|nr:B3 domain-containing protein At5g24050-like [Mangifera indica]